MLTCDICTKYDIKCEKFVYGKETFIVSAGMGWNVIENKIEHVCPSCFTKLNKAITKLVKTK